MKYRSPEKEIAELRNNLARARAALGDFLRAQTVPLSTADRLDFHTREGAINKLADELRHAELRAKRKAERAAVNTPAPA